VDQIGTAGLTWKRHKDDIVSPGLSWERHGDDIVSPGLCWERHKDIPSYLQIAAAPICPANIDLPLMMLDGVWLCIFKFGGFLFISMQCRLSVYDLDMRPISGRRRNVAARIPLCWLLLTLEFLEDHSFVSFSF